MAAVSIGLLVAIVALAAELRREGGRIGACVRGATALSRAAVVVRSELYSDIDQFLGKSPRPYEREFLKALESAYAAARISASKCRAPLSSGAAARAREVYLAAEQERNFAAEPRGNWMSFMSEVTRGRTQFEQAKSRFELEKPFIVWGDDPQTLESAVVRFFLPVAEAKARDAKLRNKEAARAGAEADRVRAGREAALTTGAQTLATRGARLERITVAMAVNADDSPRSPATTFDPYDTVYVAMWTASAPVGTEVMARWFGPDGQQVTEDRIITDRPGDGYTSFYAANSNGWVPGTYRVEVLLNGASVGSVTFSIR